MGAAERVAGDAEVAVAGESSGGMMTGACSPSPSAVVPITRRRAGACVAGRLASPLLDWPAPDGPAASFPSAGVGAVSLALDGGGDPRCEWGWVLVACDLVLERPSGKAHNLLRGRLISHRRVQTYGVGLFCSRTKSVNFATSKQRTMGSGVLSSRCIDRKLG